MQAFRPTAGALAVAMSMLCLAGTAVAVTPAGVPYEAGMSSRPQYLFLRVSNGRVTNVRWEIRERCNGFINQLIGLVTTLNARVRHGHFSKTVHYRTGGSALGFSSATTTVTGTITRATAIVRLIDREDIVSYGTCAGSRTFTTTRTTRFR